MFGLNVIGGAQKSLLMQGVWGTAALEGMSQIYANSSMLTVPTYLTPGIGVSVMPSLAGTPGMMGMAGTPDKPGSVTPDLPALAYMPGFPGVSASGINMGVGVAGFAAMYQPYMAMQGMSNIGFNFVGRASGVIPNSSRPILGIGQRGTGYGNTKYDVHARLSYNPFAPGGKSFSYERHTSQPVYEYEKQRAIDYHFQLGQKWHNRQVQVTRRSRSYDPVILDLNGDGKLDVTGKDNSVVHTNHKWSTSTQTTRRWRRITTTTTRVHEWDTYKDWNKKINFDVDGDGVVDRTEWLKKGAKDGFLVMDIDGDGKITGRELMNESDINGRKNVFKNGFEKARFYGDTNKDGIISGDELKKFKVWVDANGDGITDKGELKSLDEVGIVEINTIDGSFTRRKEVGLNESYISFNTFQVV